MENKAHESHGIIQQDVRMFWLNFLTTWPITTTMNENDRAFNIRSFQDRITQNYHSIQALFGRNHDQLCIGTEAHGIFVEIRAIGTE